MSAYEVIRIIVVEVRPAVLKALCSCGGGGTSDWLVKSDRVVCSWCGKERYGNFYAVGKALCSCGGGGESDWFIGRAEAICGWCGESRSGRVVAIAKRAALCSCGGGGKSDWFIMDDDTWICTWCGKRR